MATPPNAAPADGTGPVSQTEGTDAAPDAAGALVPQPPPPATPPGLASLPTLDELQRALAAGRLQTMSALEIAAGRALEVLELDAGNALMVALGDMARDPRSYTQPPRAWRRGAGSAHARWQVEVTPAGAPWLKAAKARADRISKLRREINDVLDTLGGRR